MPRSKHHGSKEKKKKFGDLYWCYKSTPSAWINRKMTRPQRVIVRALSRSIVKGGDREGDVLFPLAKKPHIYYW